jgi:hypothetical protein
MKRKEKRHSSMVCESWWAPDGIGWPWFEKGKSGEECQSFIKEHQCAKFSKNSEPLSLV